LGGPLTAIAVIVLTFRKVSGIRGILVRTGKYRPADEDDETVKPHLVVNSIVEAVGRDPENGGARVEQIQNRFSLLGL